MKHLVRFLITLFYRCSRLYCGHERSVHPNHGVRRHPPARENSAESHPPVWLLICPLLGGFRYLYCRWTGILICVSQTKGQVCRWWRFCGRRWTSPVAALTSCSKFRATFSLTLTSFPLLERCLWLWVRRCCVDIRLTPKTSPGPQTCRCSRVGSHRDTRTHIN